MIAARTRGALLKCPLNPASAIAGLLAVAVCLATATTLAISAPPTLTTTAPLEGAAS